MNNIKETILEQHSVWEINQRVQSATQLSYTHIKNILIDE